MASELSQAISNAISGATGKPFRADVSGGSGGGGGGSGWASTQVLRNADDRNEQYFLKCGRASDVPMLSAEYHGIKEMFDTHTIRVPKPICCDTAGDTGFVVFELLRMGIGGGGGVYRQMGRQLAAMHAHSSDGRGYGWHRGNTIGATPQLNTWCERWADFFVEYRLRYQFELAAQRRGGGGRMRGAEQCMERVRELLREHERKHGLVPSLVHGDLWTGNASVTSDGEPVIFDPATYYGDREVDLAMSELFGRFPSEFYDAYNEAWPVPDGYERERKRIYNLYHILNHGALFGGGYYGQAQTMIDRIIA